MKYIYFKSAQNNFGDDLNAWLWPKLFGAMGNEGLKNHVFWGIGSILYNENKVIDTIKEKKKIVFGTGIRPSANYSRFALDETWDIRFLRGPLSASALGNEFPYITDAAYALRQLNDFPDYLNTEKKYEVSLMPYFRSMEYFDWKSICRKLGYHYISPFSENGVDHTIKEIAASKRLITEAMHGAIVADILRTPWHRYILTTPHTEEVLVSEFKWNDWLMSVDIHGTESTFIKFYRKSFLHRYVKKLSSNILSLEILYKPTVRKELLNKLSEVNKYYLSADNILAEIDKKIVTEINKLKSDITKIRI